MSHFDPIKSNPTYMYIEILCIWNIKVLPVLKPWLYFLVIHEIWLFGLAYLPFCLWNSNYKNHAGIKQWYLKRESIWSSDSPRGKVWISLKGCQVSCWQWCRLVRTKKYSVTSFYLKCRLKSNYFHSTFWYKYNRVLCWHPLVQY